MKSIWIRFLKRANTLCPDCPAESRERGVTDLQVAQPSTFSNLHACAAVLCTLVQGTTKQSHELYQSQSLFVSGLAKFCKDKLIASHSFDSKFVLSFSFNFFSSTQTAWNAERFLLFRIGNSLSCYLKHK